ncbi:hypothetical protein [Massilia sp. DWR3-1-1]|uniref:hypothetical protein n=1 Tax=Massilia sp. DWR3-1-1 TaxID=2804559 RepID=UPI003CF8B163
MCFFPARAAALGLACVYMALPVRAQVASGLYATMHVGGNYFPKNAKDSKYSILSSYTDRTATSTGDAPPAGLATFGWFESGEVLLLQYADYLPSLKMAGARRIVKPARFPLAPQATPRYMMACAWALDDKRVPGKPGAAYAERDDANMTVKVTSVGTLLSIKWVSVPAARVAKHFGARDYCGEISRTGKSSAALWLTTTTE